MQFDRSWERYEHASSDEDLFGEGTGRVKSHEELAGRVEKARVLSWQGAGSGRGTGDLQVIDLITAWLFLWADFSGEFTG